jgi:PAS domain S-box-containing protein
MKHKDGRWVWILDRGRVMSHDAGGRPLSMFGTHADITDIKLQEEHITLLGQMLDAAPAAITIHDRAGHFYYANGFTATLHGYENVGQFLALKIRDLDVPKSVALMGEHFRQIDEREFIRFEVSHFRRDGSILPLEILAKKVVWKGQPAVLSIATDITERRQAEERLRESETRHRLLAEATIEGILIHKNGIAVDVNTSLAKMLGYDREKLLNKNILEMVHEEDRETVHANMARDYVPPHVIRMAGKNGKYFFAELEARNLMEQGKMLRVTAIRDVTERLALEEQFRQAQKMESIGRLAGGVAHDFNNMLGVILGCAEMAMDKTSPDSPVGEYLRQISTAAGRSAEITKQLLAFARKQTISPKVLDLREVIEGVLKMLRRMIGEDVSLVWMPASNLWHVRMDVTQIGQILANLCVNARDAISGVGKVTIGAHNDTLEDSFCASRDALPGDYICLSVSDDGCGMTGEILDRIFEPFYTTKEVGKGTGLGLATIYGIVRQNNGIIDVQSEPGMGTTFRIYLPRHAAQPDADSKENSDAVRPRGDETVMLVEDEPILLNIAQAMLKQLGYRVLAAPSPVGALRLAGEHPGTIDLLMTDVILPEMNGRELADRMLSFYPEMKILFNSGYSADVIAHHGVLLDDTFFLQKPFSREALAIKIRETLNHPPPGMNGQ